MTTASDKPKPLVLLADKSGLYDRVIEFLRVHYINIRVYSC